MKLALSKPLYALSMLALAASAQADVRHDEGIGMYVGLDGRVTFPSGQYVGLANPNGNRLTLLFDHGNHFHAIGGYSLSGNVPDQVILPTSGSNSIPEAVSHGVPQDPLVLEAGSGLYAGTLRSMVSASEYSYLGMASIQSLAGFGAGSAEEILLTSSGNRWSQSLDGLTVGLELLSATPGLKIGDASDTDLFDGGSIITLGAGNSFAFSPIFWVDDGVAPGMYTATMRLVNLSSLDVPAVGDSGEFNFKFEVAPVPEPETYALMLAGLGLVGWAAHRRRKAG